MNRSTLSYVLMFLLAFLVSFPAKVITQAQETKLTTDLVPAATGGGFFSVLYALTGKAEYKDVAGGAVAWLLKIRRLNGCRDPSACEHLSAVRPLLFIRRTSGNKDLHP